MEKFRFERLRDGAAAVHLPDGILVFNPGSEALESEVAGRRMRVEAGGCTWTPVESR